jgi:hypothetical protein
MWTLRTNQSSVKIEQESGHSTATQILEYAGCADTEYTVELTLLVGAVVQWHCWSF